MTTPTTEIDWPTTAAQAAHNGAVLLDEIKPDWFTRVDVGKLAMYDAVYCVLGQVYREAAGSAPFDDSGYHYATYTKKIFTSWIETHTRDGEEVNVYDTQCYFGFNSDGGEEISFADLNTAWRAEIASRLEQRPETPTQDSTQDSTR